MGIIRLDGELYERDGSKIENNGILYKELSRILEPHKKRVLLAQSVPSDFGTGISIGVYENIVPNPQNSFCLVLSPSASLIMDSQKGEFDVQERKFDALPLGYNSCNVARIVDSGRRILFENEDVLKNWRELFNTWLEVRKKSPDKVNHYLQTAAIDGILKVYGIEDI